MATPEKDRILTTPSTRDFGGSLKALYHPPASQVLNVQTNRHEKWSFPTVILAMATRRGPLHDDPAFKP
jgi:hypothetical protein